MYDGSISEPVTIGKIITKYNVINLENPTNTWTNHLTFRYFELVKDYLIEDDSYSNNRYVMKFIPALNDEYMGGGIKTYE